MLAVMLEDTWIVQGGVIGFISPVNVSCSKPLGCRVSRTVRVVVETVAALVLSLLGVDTTRVTVVTATPVLSHPRLGLFLGLNVTRAAIVLSQGFYSTPHM
jgi:hypothetical protein